MNLNFVCLPSKGLDSPLFNLLKSKVFKVLQNRYSSNYLFCYCGVIECIKDIEDEHDKFMLEIEDLKREIAKMKTNFKVVEVNF